MRRIHVRFTVYTPNGIRAVGDFYPWSPDEHYSVNLQSATNPSHMWRIETHPMSIAADAEGFPTGDDMWAWVQMRLRWNNDHLGEYRPAMLYLGLTDQPTGLVRFVAQNWKPGRTQPDGFEVYTVLVENLAVYS